jgi:prepilin-type N-terminal cleavage/methylation domain-containing protein
MRGFTLMETLLAIGIFAILSLAVMTGLLVSSRQGELTWQAREAFDLAISRLEVEQYSGEPLQEITSNVYNLNYSEELNPVYKVAEVIVSWERFGVLQSVSLSRVILK